MAIRWMMTSHIKTWAFPNLNIEAHTSDPVKLYLHWVPHKPRMRLKNRTFRGFTERHYPVYPIISRTTLASHESTEGTVHTFTIPNWEVCMTRWWYFSATKGGVLTDSVSPLFSAHAVEPSIPFGTVIMWGGRENPTPLGIGGDASVIWHTDSAAGRIYELSPGNFAAIKMGTNPHFIERGIGGDPSVIWAVDERNRRIYELSIIDFSIIRAAPSPGTIPTGIGGDASVIWHADINAKRVYELSTANFSVIQAAPSPRSGPTGIGGDASVIWHVDQSARITFKLGTGR